MGNIGVVEMAMEYPQGWVTLGMLSRYVYRDGRCWKRNHRYEWIEIKDEEEIIKFRDEALRLDASTSSRTDEVAHQDPMLNTRRRVTYALPYGRFSDQLDRFLIKINQFSYFHIEIALDPGALLIRYFPWFIAI